MVLESFLGETLVKNDGTEFKTSELSTEKGGVIGIYFSAHWCPPCREFTPKLAFIYNELKDAGKDFEIVFVSKKEKKKKKKLIFSCIAKNSKIDKDEESFKGYFAEQPWLAIPYANDENKDALKEKYQVRFYFSVCPILVLRGKSPLNGPKRDQFLLKKGPFRLHRIATESRLLDRLVDWGW